jgi:2'-hydroxyisoflavone reductase
MRVLVIGGIEFMGRATVRRLVERGHDVTVLHRRAEHDLGPEVGNLQADRADLARVAGMVREGRFEAVYDFAYDFVAGTTGGQVEAVARACGDSLHRYVFMSSIAVYGGGIDLREDHPLVPDDFPEPYSANKAAAERALFCMLAESGFPVTTFRPPFVHGPGQMFYREAFFWDRMRAGRPIILPDGGTSPIQWVFVQDVAEACVRALEVDAAAGEAFNVAHREVQTQREFVETLGRAAGEKPEFAEIPRETITAAGGALLGPTIYFGELLDLPPHTSAVDKVERVLGLTPTPLEKALRASFDWYMAQPQRAVDYTFEDGLLLNA